MEKLKLTKEDKTQLLMHRITTSRYVDDRSQEFVGIRELAELLAEVLSMDL